LLVEGAEAGEGDERSVGRTTPTEATPQERQREEPRDGAASLLPLLEEQVSSSASVVYRVL
ncbi:hypothetical protein BHM03_00062267, partial [Ensete ventricosum]